MIQRLYICFYPITEASKYTVQDKNKLLNKVNVHDVYVHSPHPMMRSFNISYSCTSLVPLMHHTISYAYGLKIHARVVELNSQSRNEIRTIIPDKS